MGNKTVDDPWTAADRTRREKGIQELQKTMDSITARNVKPNSPLSEPTVTLEEMFGEDAAARMRSEVGGVAKRLEKKNPGPS